ncbi:MAG TPA: Ig-like domain-containing protein, partial [Longimicrobiales bacterium]|nr:Ig-like domain-containing protein [Longimicrobiales bacterium]
ITASATAGAPAGIEVVSASGQTAVTGTALVDAPRVRVEDPYGNPVPGVTIGFATTGGTLGAPAAVTGPNGEASTTWAPSVSGGTMQEDGTFPDTLFAAVQGAPALTTMVIASAIYSYAAHVDASWASDGCTGCHAGTSGGASGLSLGGSPAQNHAQLTRDASPTCDATLVTYRIVHTAGGTGGFGSSLLPVIAAPSGGTLGTCGFPGHGRLSAASYAVIEAWIRNGAPAN